MLKAHKVKIKKTHCNCGKLMKSKEIKQIIIEIPFYRKISGNI